MVDWISVVIAVVFVILGFFLGYRVKGASEKYIGTIIVDNVNPEVNGGVYTVFDTDPHALKSGDKISMDILVADVGAYEQSQQKQGA